MRHTVVAAGAVAVAVLLGGVGVAAATPDEPAPPAPKVTPAPPEPAPPAPARPGRVVPEPLAPGPSEHRHDDGMPRVRPEAPGPVAIPRDRPTPPPPVRMPPAEVEGDSGRCPEPARGSVACGFTPGQPGRTGR